MLPWGLLVSLLVSLFSLGLKWCHVSVFLSAEVVSLSFEKSKVAHLKNNHLTKNPVVEGKLKVTVSSV